MGRSVDAEQLVGATEISRRLGVARTQVVHNWRTRHHDFPEPVAELEAALIWYWPDIEEWAISTGRYPVDG